MADARVEADMKHLIQWKIAIALVVVTLLVAVQIPVLNVIAAPPAQPERTIVTEVASVPPVATQTPVPTPSPTPIPTPTPKPTPRYPVPPNLIVTTCKPAPVPSTDAQIWLSENLNPLEYCWAYWIIKNESGWHVDSQSNPREDSACGLPQAYYCSKMSQCLGYLNSSSWPGCVPVPDWRTNWKGQLEWMEWWIYFVMKPDARHPPYSQGGTRYGSFAEVACRWFGCRTSNGWILPSYGYY